MRPFSLFKAVLIPCLIFLTFILCENRVLAQVNIGKLSAFRGEVELERQGSIISLELNMTIVAKDRVRVEEGMAEIQYDDGSTLTIRPYTDITLDQVEQKRKILGLWTKTYLSRLVSIFKGRISGIIKKRRDLVTEFETPTLVAAVRGTTIDIAFDEETGTTTISSNVGVVDVFTHDGWTFMTLNDGNSVAVRLERDDEGNVVGTWIVNTGAGDITVKTPEGEMTLPEGMRIFIPTEGTPGPAEPYGPPERPGPEVPGEGLPPGLNITIEPASPV